MSKPLQLSFFSVLLPLVFCLLAAWGLTRLSKDRATQGRDMRIDGLRGFLALAVFFSHFVGLYYFQLTGQWGNLPYPFFAHAGAVAVCLFFMVTGYLFWSKMLEKRGHMDWVSLYISRIFRITPLYWFMTVVIVAVVFWMSHLQILVPIKLLVRQILIWLSFTDYPNINKYKETVSIVFGVIWTIRYEWAFYLTLPFQALFILWSEKFRPALWLLAAIAVGISIRPIYIDALHISTFYAIYFLAGALGAWLVRVEKARNLAKSWIATCIGVVSLMAAFTLFNTDFVFTQAIFIGVFFIVIAGGNSLFGLLENKPAALLGEISYSVYLLHGILIFILYTALFPRYFSLQTTALQLYGNMAGVGMLVVLSCWLTYNLIEQPFIKLGRRLAHALQRKEVKKLERTATNEGA